MERSLVCITFDTFPAANIYCYYDTICLYGQIRIKVTQTIARRVDRICTSLVFVARILQEVEETQRRCKETVGDIAKPFFENPFCQ